MRARREVRGSAPLFWQRIDDARSTCVDSLSSATLKNGGKQLGSELRVGAERCAERDNAWFALARSARERSGRWNARAASELSCEAVRSCATVALRLRAPNPEPPEAALRREEGRAPLWFRLCGCAV